MKDNVIIITGGSSGMGKAMALKSAQEGMRVAITGRDLEKLAAAKQEIEAAIGQEDRVLTVQMDVRQPELVQHMVDSVLAKWGRIDHLVNNAAGNFLVRAEELSVNGWNSVINIVLNGTWYCSQAVAKHWIAEGKKGSMLNIVATYAWTAGAGVVHSAAAKAGVLSLTRTLAVEWGSQYGIRVNAIAPGPIENTGGAEKLILSEKAYQATLKSVPSKRFGRPDEVANLAYFLLSDQADYINGDCITIDGGQWLNRQPF